MEQLSLVTALVILCTLTPTIVSHKLLHAGELINRENAKIRLGQLRQRTRLKIAIIIIIAIASHSIIMTLIIKPIETGIKVNVYPANYLSSGDWVKMSWQYVSNPSVYDWIGVYSPPLDDIYRINPSVHAPIKVQVTCRAM